MSCSVSFAKFPVRAIPSFCDPSEVHPLRISFVKEQREEVIASGNQTPYWHSDVIRIGVDASCHSMVEAIFLRIKETDDTQMTPEYSFQGHFFRDIPAENARQFFSTISETLWVQSFSIPLLDFQKVIQGLTERNHVTLTEKLTFSGRVPTSLTQDEYEAEIERTSDVPQAISYAQALAREGKLMHALKWLAKAKNFLSKEGRGASLDTFVRLDEFWKQIVNISGVGVIIFDPCMKELADQAAQTPSVTEIDLQISPADLGRYREGIANFLRQSPFVERFSIAVPVGLSEGKSDFLPIAESLKVNKSLKIVRVVDYSIGDEGVRQIVEALSSNPVILELSVPDMTDVGARCLLELRKKKPFS